MLNSSIRSTLIEKLSRVRVSGKFVALLDCMLDKQPRRTSPALAELVATSDGFVLGRRAGDIGFNDILCTVTELERNVKGLAAVAELTEDELQALLDMMPATSAA